MRRRSQVDSSLELLLDTICNTFGGILFIAILVSILLQQSSRHVPRRSQVPKISQVQFEEMRAELARVERQLADLRQSRSQQETVNRVVTDPETDEAFEQRASHRQAVEEATKEKNRLLAEVSLLYGEITRTQEERKSLEDQVLEAKEAAAELKVVMEKLTEEHTEDLHLPTQHMSSKPKVALVVKFNRLYVWHRYDATGSSGMANTDDFVLVPDGSDIRCIPKPYAGIPLVEDGAEARVCDRLRLFSPQHYAIDVIVWPDSYDSFRAVKVAMVQSGFEYSLRPTADGEVWADCGGEDVPVQ